MLSLLPSVRMFVATQPVDGRKGVEAATSSAATGSSPPRRSQRCPCSPTRSRSPGETSAASYILDPGMGRARQLAVILAGVLDARADGRSGFLTTLRVAGGQAVTLTAIAMASDQWRTVGTGPFPPLRAEPNRITKSPKPRHQGQEPLQISMSVTII